MATFKWRTRKDLETACCEVIEIICCRIAVETVKKTTKSHSQCMGCLETEIQTQPISNRGIEGYHHTNMVSRIMTVSSFL